MTVVLTFAVAIIVALIGGRSQDARQRWIILCLMAVLTGLGFVGICLASIAARGASRTSAAILVMACCSSCACVLLIAPRFPTKRVRLDGVKGWFISRPQLRHNDFNQRVLLWVWLVVTFVLALIPLRYMGTFTRDPVANALSKAVSLGYFKPLTEVRPLEVGQCLQAHRAQEPKNVVIPCGVPHRAEVVVAGEPGTTKCPNASEYNDPGLRLHVDDILIDGTRFCLLVSDSSTRTWDGQLNTRLPRTT